ncbi:MAG: [citrate (pro-3S)-lyase] ligase [Campylobacterales bacterium]|nr:[citrate (pro-3S)-lyase] ligase [Campylobacterales bacterium]
MKSGIKFNEFDSTNTRRVKKVNAFLDTAGLDPSPDIEVYVSAKEGDEMIACGGLSGKVLKCIAVAPHKRGEGLILTIMSQLLNAAYARDRKELFLFSKPKYLSFFEECGFHLIEQCNDEIMLMENTHNLALYKKELAAHKKEGELIGSIVMNANPFTLGHQYLVTEAAKRSSWLHLFVVKEDASAFAFKDRIALIRQGVAHLSNVTVHEGSDYIISKATFPTYFIKDKGRIDALYAMLDLSIFKHHLAPILGITHRFVGTEPYCKLTNHYNQTMKVLLEKEEEDAPPIHVVEIERMTFEHQAISASRVRRLLAQKNYEELSRIVPHTTLEFLMKEVANDANY